MVITQFNLYKNVGFTNMLITRDPGEGRHDGSGEFQPGLPDPVHHELPESSHGYRCPSWDPMPDGKKNVVVLGCSHTYGVGLEDDEHWVHHVSQHNTGRLRYWNLGQPGASADKVVRILYGCEKVIYPSIRCLRCLGQRCDYILLPQHSSYRLA